MRRLAGTLALLLSLTAGCRGDSAPAPGGGVDQQVGDIESTLDAVESEMAGD
ncbi:hypothetical protein [Actinophytocola algeriensis]|uniref:Uncharacterized protein n=1 Tax=Actinophytocola algeriensis TaxID=1768010 RepID=A0A7W7VE51_9PSEU|nr:hypothetical protein [Actinophytocola algeriensis]MBB4906764.1 hypothetical protein [Actinophytocola algeriensis]MBE1478245.1 hypothetical protein [Actinophytocola algeriensis]